MDKIEKVKGWVARDDDGTLAIHYEKPRRVCYYNNEIVLDGTPWVWENEAGYGLLPVKIFPDLKWEDEPLEVELTIKRISTLSEEPNKGLDVTDFCKPIDPGIAQCVADHWWEMLDSKEPDKSLEEAAEISFDEADTLAKDYVNFLAKGLTENKPRPIGPHWFSEYAKKRFIAGAEWGAEHLRDTTKVINKSLEEAAEEFAEGEWDGVAVDTDGNPLYAQDEIEYAFKAGAEWQKEQMLKDVVETEVWNYSSDEYLRAIPLFGIDKFNNLKDGDKVKVIVFKDNEDESK